MNLAEVIRAQKSSIDVGPWHAGHVPRSAFPLSKVKDRHYKYGPSYSWRVVKFLCLGFRCRVLIQLNEGKQIYRARLGIEVAGDMVCLCDHEFHSSEPGWHCHFTRNDLNSIEPGTVRGGKRRRPRMEDPAATFTVTKANALSLAAKRYGFAIVGDLL